MANTQEHIEIAVDKALDEHTAKDWQVTMRMVIVDPGGGVSVAINAHLMTPKVELQLDSDIDTSGPSHHNWRSGGFEIYQGDTLLHTEEGMDLAGPATDELEYELEKGVEILLNAVSRALDQLIKDGLK